MTTPVRHDPPTDDPCRDTFIDDFAECVCQLPDGHDSDGWHDCVCGQTWHTTYAPSGAQSHADARTGLNAAREPREAPQGPQEVAE